MSLDGAAPLDAHAGPGALDRQGGGPDLIQPPPETCITPSYIALIEIADVGYGVIFPDCPGCTAMGDTFAEAFSHGVEALSDWVSSHRAGGLDAPRRRHLAEIRADPAFAEHLAAAPLVISVPLLVNDRRAVKATEPDSRRRHAI